MKKRLILCLLSLCMLLGTLFTGGCREKQKEKYSTYSFEWFDTVTSITGYAESQEEFDRISADILNLLGEYHRLYTIYHRFDGMENLCTVNELVDGVHRTVTVDKRIIDMLLFAKEMYRRTDGKVNVAMGSVLSLWHECRESGMNDPTSASLPPMEKLRAAAEHTDIEDLVIDEEKSTVTLRDPLMKLDVGAVAKGYAVEMVARAMEAAGTEGYVLNVGGNVRAIGPKSDGDGWIAGIENPDGSEESPYFAKVSLTREALVTSGSYQRFYMVDGKKYHHIIDPETLMPATEFISVSVICENSGMGDALSTALFCMDLSEGMRLIEAREGVEALWVETDGTQHRSSGFSRYEK